MKIRVNNNIGFKGIRIPFSKQKEQLPDMWKWLFKNNLALASKREGDFLDLSSIEQQRRLSNTLTDEQQEDYVVQILEALNIEHHRF